MIFSIFSFKLKISFVYGKKIKKYQNFAIQKDMNAH